MNDDQYQWARADEWELQFSEIFDQVDAFAAGTPTNVVNPDVLASLGPPGTPGRTTVRTSFAITAHHNADK